MSSPPSILIVGAGAVGQAYAFHLAQSGAAVTFLVKDKYLRTMEHGLDIHVLAGPQRGRHHLTHLRITSELDEAMEGAWDQVWLCVSSPALHGDWLNTLCSKLGDATLVMLQPGMHDYERVTRLVPESQVVRGMITLVSYKAPLEGDTGEPAMTWWFPPFSPTPFAGESTRVNEVVSPLKAGGLPAKHVRELDTQLRVGSALLMPLIAALEDAEWSLDQVSQPERLKLAAKAARQCLDISIPGRLNLVKALLTRPWLLHLALSIAPRLTPFNLEAMLRFHFTKVGLQTRVMLQEYEDSATPQQATDAINALRVRIGE